MIKIKNDERFNNLASGFQSIVLATAVLVGGLWTLVTFNLLSLREQAKSQLEKLNNELKAPAALDIQINGSSVAIPGQSGWYLLSTVLVKNVSNKTATLDFTQQEPFLVFPVSFGADGQPSFEIEKVKKFRVIGGGNPDSSPPEYTVRAGTTETFVFATAIDKPGLYLLSFSVPVPSSDREALPSKAEGSENFVRWSGKKFITVPDNKAGSALPNQSSDSK